MIVQQKIGTKNLLEHHEAKYMKYPIDGVTYKHTPKFVDRMKDDEGKINTPFRQEEEDNGDPVGPLVTTALKAALNKAGVLKED